MKHCRHCLNTYRVLCLVSIAFWFISCGDQDIFSNNGDKPADAINQNTGAIKFDLKLSERSTSQLSTKAVDCSENGILHIRAECYNQADELLASGQWDCELHSGALSDVKSGEDYTLLLFAADGSGKTNFYGGVSVAEVMPGGTTDAGEVTMVPVTDADTGAYQSKTPK